MRGEKCLGNRHPYTTKPSVRAHRRVSNSEQHAFMQYCRVRYEPGVDPNGKEVHSRPVYKRSADSISPKVLSMRLQAKMVRKNAVWNCTPRTGTASAPSSSTRYLCVYTMLKLPQVLQSRPRKLNCSVRRILTAARMEALRRRTWG